eukprot:TRINITY_DN10073_c0_g1_i1.p1 TRINITY_DN10073_c0_g1~~TRINITY_DN10073_c0_g1_i1.p1  ORF type:complete len:353 (-),score=75.85 TRINITY_DN10073_c0_g1_i1:106-1164(-)
MDSELSHSTIVPGNLAIANRYSQIAEEYKDSAEWEKATEYLLKASSHFKLAANEVEEAMSKNALLLLSQNHERRHHELVEFTEALKRKIQMEEEEDHLDRLDEPMPHHARPHLYAPPALSLSESDSLTNSFEDSSIYRGPGSPFEEIRSGYDDRPDLPHPNDRWYELIDGMCQVVNQVTDNFKSLSIKKNNANLFDNEGNNLCNSEDSFFMVSDEVPPPLPPRKSSNEPGFGIGSGLFSSWISPKDGNAKELAEENEMLKKKIHELSGEKQILLKKCERMAEIEKENAEYKMVLMNLKSRCNEIRKYELSFSQCQPENQNNSMIRYPMSGAYSGSGGSKSHVDVGALGSSDY